MLAKRVEGKNVKFKGRKKFGGSWKMSDEADFRHVCGFVSFQFSKAKNVVFESLLGYALLGQASDPKL